MGIKDIIAIVSAAFAAFLFLDGRHTHDEDIVHLEAEINRNIKMSDSTRYAEVEKFYKDRLVAGESLSESELARLELVQKQQQRIRESLQ